MSGVTTTDGSAATGSRRASWALFLGAFSVFWILRSNFYDGDGLRYAAPALWSGHWFNGANHALTPAWVRIWWALVGWMVPDGFDTAVRTVQVFNHLCGASSVLLVARIVWKSGGSRMAGVAAGAVLLSTWGMLYHSTHFAEPMVGLAWFLVAWDQLAGREKPCWRSSMASAAAYAVATASYQPFVVAAPGLMLATRSVRMASLWGATAAATGFVLFGGAAVAEGARDLGGLLEYARGPLNVRGKGVYWGVFKPERLLQALLGATHMVLAMYRQYGWAGFRRSFGSLDSLHRALLLAKASAVVIGLLWVAVRAWTLRRQPVVWQAAALLAPAVLAVSYWDPYYLKLWLLPAAVLAVVAGRAADDARSVRALLAVAAAFCALNLPFAVLPDMAPDNLQVMTLRAVEDSVGPKDMLIADSWGVLNRYFAKNANAHALYSVTTAADDPGLVRLRGQVAATRAAGGRIYLYGLVGTPDREWSEGAGLLGGLPAEVRDQWARRSRRVWKGSEKGVGSDLYELVEPWP